MAKKTQRDPNAPKRNLSAYLLYQNAMRDHFKAQNPGMTFGQLAKYTSAMYAEMPPHEKEAWNARAEADKARYLHELGSYVPPPGYDAKGDAIRSTTAIPYGAPVTSGKRTKAEKDPGAPRRNVSAYLLYQNAMRAQFKLENPDMTFGQLAKYTSHMYKNLTPEEKATWDARAVQDKARYDAAIAQYVPPPGHDARGNLISSTRPGKRSKRGPKDPAAPKRARGSFVFFTFEMRPIIMQENPNVEFVQMGTILGERWRALLPEQKKRYEDMAAQDKIRFQVEMEKYKANLQHQQNLAHANAQQAMAAQAQLQHAQMTAANAVAAVANRQAQQQPITQHQMSNGMIQQQYYSTQQELDQAQQLAQQQQQQQQQQVQQQQQHYVEQQQAQQQQHDPQTYEQQQAQQQHDPQAYEQQQAQQQQQQVQYEQQQYEQQQQQAQQQYEQQQQQQAQQQYEQQQQQQQYHGA